MRLNSIHFSLVQPRQIGGVDSKLLLINIGMFILFIVSLHILYFLAVNIVMHLFSKRVCKNDQFILPIYVKYARQGDVYDPWPHVGQRRFARPPGFAKGVLC